MNKPVSFKPVTSSPDAGSNREHRLTRGWRRNLPISLLGGVALMLAAAIGQSLHFGIEQLSVSSLGTPFILGAAATYFMLRLMQRSLGEQRGRLEWEFLQRTLDLRNTEARFEQFTESADEWFWETDADDRLVFLSSRLYQVSGLSPDTLIGKKREELRMHPPLPEEADQWAYYRRCIERREPYENLQYRSQMADGRIVVFRSSGKPFYDDAGNFVGYRGTASDVTEETARESSIEANRELIYNATAILSDGFYLFDADDRLVMCNPRYREIFAPIAALFEPGAPYAEIMRAIAGQLEFVDETERQAWLSQSLQRHREPGIPIDAQLLDGGWIQIKEQRLPDGGLVGLCIDVSESKAVEEELEMAQRISDIGSYRMDFDSGTMISISPQLARIYGLSLEQISAYEDQYMIDRVHPDDRDRVRDAYENARHSKDFRAGDLLFEIEYRLLRSDGEVRHILERTDIARVRDGRIREVVGTMQDLTERRRVEAELEAAQRIARVGSFRWDVVNNRLLHLSDEFARIHGCTVDEMRAQAEHGDPYLTGFIHPDDKQRVTEVFEEHDATGKPYELSFRLLLPDGGIRHVIEFGDPIYARDGKLVEFRGIIQDVTERKRAEQELEDAQQLAHIGSFSWDLERDRMIGCTREFLRIYDRDLETIVGLSEGEFVRLAVHPEDVERVLGTYRQSDFSRGITEMEYRIVRPSGEIRHVIERLSVSVWRDGNAQEQIGTLQDITERKQTEQAMEEAERLARTGSYRWDLERDRMISCTPELLRIFNVKPEQVIHRSVDELEGMDIHPEDRERVLAVYRDCTRAKGITEVEYRHLTRSGETRYLVERLRTSKWSGDKPVEQIGTVQDITDRRAVEQDKRASEDLLEAAIENVPGGFLMVDRDGIITRFNRRFFDLYPQQQFFINEGLPFDRFLEHGMERGVYAEAVDDPETWLEQRRAQTNAEQIEFIDRLSDGRSIQVASRRLPNGTRVGIHVDVTELENARLAAEQANAAKSDFLASMSHELRTPMHGILSFAELGIKRMESLSQEKLSQYLENIQTSGNRLLFLLNDLLDLSKLEAGKMSLDIAPLNLVDLVQACINEQTMLLHENQLGCELVTNLSGARCDCDRNRIYQVVSNVLSNAIKFSPEGGRIEVGLESVEGGFRIEVADQGIGIPEEELEQIFDKFYQSARSRNHSGGTGLGLAICREIIELHGGRIWAENNAEGGSRILFELPGETRLH